ncbi:energy transducer TonB [Allosphingosinicella indica]|uniref:Protein TonB n=1 Tax=Allosphingosinicella indica TaxID=941907 RepID=A0A1X7G0H7_9SPHN|nr:energy transducer TonB [Allosphingosinicella indica]SMF61373.1 protein TonB [Allosphingosinicella indica]
MAHAWSQDRSRVGGAALTALVHAALGAGLLWGLGVPVSRVVERPLEVFDVLPPPPLREEKIVPPPPRKSPSPEPRRKFAPGREGAAAPPNLKSRATEIMAPDPVIRLPVPPPITAAPVPDTAFDASMGAAPVRGPGTGAGGVGNGRGSGAGGDGDGGGGGWRDDSPPRLIRELRAGDYPRAAADAGIGGTVGVLYTITADGRAVECEVTRSSGDGQLDADTCALVERRYRYDPSRDWRGRPVVSRIEHSITWEVREIPPDRR